MEKDENGDLSVLYSACVTEIISFKSQQWHTTNYALLLYGVLIAIAQTFKNLSGIEIVGLYIIAFAVFFVAVFVVLTLFDSIHVRRQRLVQIRKMMPEGFRLAWRYGKQVEDVSDNPDEKIKLSWLFYAVLSVGLLITIWLLARLTQIN